MHDVQQWVSLLNLDAKRVPNLYGFSSAHRRSLQVAGMCNKQRHGVMCSVDGDSNRARANLYSFH